MKFSEFKRKLKTKKKDRWLNSFDFKILKVTMIRIQWNSFFFPEWNFNFYGMYKNSSRRTHFCERFIPCTSMIISNQIWWISFTIHERIFIFWNSLKLTSDLFLEGGTRSSSGWVLIKFYSTYHIDFIDFNFEDS